MKHVCEEKIAEYLKSINTFLTKLEEKDVFSIINLRFRLLLLQLNQKASINM